MEKIKQVGMGEEFTSTRRLILKYRDKTMGSHCRRVGEGHLLDKSFLFLTTELILLNLFICHTYAIALWGPWHVKAGKVQVEH